MSKLDALKKRISSMEEIISEFENDIDLDLDNDGDFDLDDESFLYASEDDETVEAKKSEDTEEVVETETVEAKKSEDEVTEEEVETARKAYISLLQKSKKAKKSEEEVTEEDTTEASEDEEEFFTSAEDEVKEEEVTEASEDDADEDIVEATDLPQDAHDGIATELGIDAITARIAKLKKASVRLDQIADYAEKVGKKTTAVKIDAIANEIDEEIKSLKDKI